MIFWIYNVLLIVLSPLWVPWMIWRASKRKERPDWKQRTGEVRVSPPSKGTKRVWIHAVSVGEVMAAVPVLREVKRLEPDLDVVLSTTTTTGQAAAKERAVGLYDHLIYFPIDVPRFVVAALARVRPDVVAVFETELWMNFLWAAKQFRARTLVVNGRISDRTESRAWLLRPYYRAMAKHVDEVFAQSEEDAARFRSLGFQTVMNAGNTKFDAALSGPSDADWRGELGVPPGMKVIVVGSTRSELEEKLVVEGLGQAGLRDGGDFWVVHAPRHLERSEAIEQEYRTLGVRSIGRRSTRQVGQVTILDTIGELAGVYGIADVAIVGGGFDDLGGQDVLQPLAHGVPVIHGPHMQNFKVAATLAQAAGASVVVCDSASLGRAVNALLEDDGQRRTMGEAAKALIATHSGAALACAKAITGAIKDRAEARRDR